MPNQNENESDLNTQAVLAMKASGYYSRNTAGAKISIDATQNLLDKALGALPNSRILKFADFGCADGGTSQQLWYNLINALRVQGDNRPIEMVYTDLASNDFSTLFKTMQGIGPDTGYAYQKIFKDVYVYGCGTGFHEQLLPENSLSLGFSATAMHYISEKPCQIRDHVHMVGAARDERREFEKQASKDWQDILLARAKELQRGGRFVCINFGIDQKGQYLGNTGGHSMFEKFRDHWHKMLTEGIITGEEYTAATFPQHYRTVEEFCRPFTEKNSQVQEAMLKLNSCTTQVTKCPYRQNYERNRAKMSARQYAKDLMPTMRSWSETVFRNAIKDRKETEINHIIDSFYNNYEDEVANNPEGHAMDYVHIIMEIEKT